jgi:DNA polymerase-3 subunit alpha/error-prone DNA polymerase
LANNLINYLKKEVKLIAYLVSIKQKSLQKWNDVFWHFGSMQDYFDTAHFPKSLINYSFKGGGCYYALGTVEVDYHFPTITISKWPKCL